MLRYTNKEINNVVADVVESIGSSEMDVYNCEDEYFPEKVLSLDHRFRYIQAAANDLNDEFAYPLLSNRGLDLGDVKISARKLFFHSLYLLLEIEDMTRIKNKEC